jgi:hypothetical protein
MKNSILSKTIFICLMIILSLTELSSAQRHNQDSLYPGTSCFQPIADYLPEAPKPASLGEGPLEYCNSAIWSSALNFVIKDSLAYLAMVNGLMILNINNPVEPTFVSQYYISEGGAWDIKVVNNYAYLALYDGALCIIDITNPASPRLAGKYITPRSAYGVDIEDSLAYIAYGYMSEAIGLLILNISNPANITLVADVPAEGMPRIISLMWLVKLNYGSGMSLIRPIRCLNQNSMTDLTRLI